MQQILQESSLWTREIHTNRCEEGERERESGRESVRDRERWGRGERWRVKEGVRNRRGEGHELPLSLSLSPLCLLPTLVLKDETVLLFTHTHRLC